MSSLNVTIQFWGLLIFCFLRRRKKWLFDFSCNEKIILAETSLDGQGDQSELTVCYKSPQTGGEPEIFWFPLSFF